MPQSAVINSLIGKFGEHQRRSIELSEELQRLEAEMQAIGTCIKLYDADYPIQEIKGKRKNRKMTGFLHGELSRLVYEYVRAAKGEFLGTDIVSHVMECKSSFEYSFKEQAQIAQRVSGALKRLHSKQVITECRRASNRAIIWKRLD